MRRGEDTEQRGDDGFVLMESIVAITLMGIVMAALTPFFADSITFMTRQRATQTATQIATSAVETVRGLPASDVVTGHDNDSVTAQFAGAPAALESWLSRSIMTPAVDTAAASGAGRTAVVPTTSSTRTVNNLVYSVTTYLGRCRIPLGASTTDCSAATSADSVEYLRAVVSVTWSQSRCPAAGCSYVTATLLNATADPTFNLKQAPTAFPVVVNPGNQTSTVNTAITPLQLAVQSGSGVPTLTWTVTAGTLPAGLALTPAGMVSGIPTAVSSSRSTSVTVTVTDGFLRTASATFTWVVVAPPTVVSPGAQRSALLAPVNLALTTTCPAAPCSYALLDGPPNLTVSADGVIQGSITGTAQTYGSVTVRVTDSNGATATTAPFTWTVVARPTIGAPGSQTTAVGATPSVSLAYTCPYASCTITLENTVPGLGLSTTTPRTTSNTTLSLAVTATSGTVYINGLVPSAAVTSGTSTVYAPTVTITDGSGANATPAAGTWRVYQGATIAAPGRLTATEGNVKSVPLSYTCPNPNCTITLTGTVPGLGLTTSSTATGNVVATTLTVSGTSGTVYVGGTVQTTAVPSGGGSAAYTPTVRISDTTGTVVTPAAGSWTIFEPPSLGAVGTRSVTITGTESVPMAYTCPNAPCTVTVSNAVPGLGLSNSPSTATTTTTSLTLSSTSGTVYLTGLVGSGAVTSGTSRAWATSVTLTDSGASAVSTAGTWTAFTAPTITSPGDQAAEPGQALAFQIAGSCPNGGCTYRAEAQIPGDSTWYQQGVSSTGRITYDAGLGAGTYVIRFTVTDADNVSAQTTFSLIVRTFALTIPNQTSSRPLVGTRTYTVDVAALMNPVAAGYTYTLSGQPSWLTISSTGVLTATVGLTSQSDTSITVTVTSTASPTSNVVSTFSWTLR